MGNILSPYVCDVQILPDDTFRHLDLRHPTRGEAPATSLSLHPSWMMWLVTPTSGGEWSSNPRLFSSTYTRNELALEYDQVPVEMCTAPCAGRRQTRTTAYRGRWWWPRGSSWVIRRNRPQFLLYRELSAGRGSGGRTDPEGHTRRRLSWRPKSSAHCSRSRSLPAHQIA